MNLWRDAPLYTLRYNVRPSELLGRHATHYLRHSAERCTMYSDATPSNHKPNAPNAPNLRYT